MGSPARDGRHITHLHVTDALIVAMHADWPSRLDGRSQGCVNGGQVERFARHRRLELNTGFARPLVPAGSPRVWMEAFNDPREEMASRVVGGVQAPPRRVDLQLYWGADLNASGRVHEVIYVWSIVSHVQNVSLADATAVCLLPASLRMEDRTVKAH